MKDIIIVLDNIRSAHNVGSILRTADGFGVSRVFLCGTTPQPIDRFGRSRKDIAKVALGAEKTVFWEYFKKTEDAIAELKQDSYKIVSVEQTNKSISYKTLKPEEKTAFVFGNEVEGVSDYVIAESDHVVEIPMRGNKESFNVSVAVGVVLSHLN